MDTLTTDSVITLTDSLTQFHHKLDLNNKVYLINDSNCFFDLLPLLVVIIGGIIALYQVNLNIVTSARVKKIEELRTLLTDFSSAVYNLNTTIKNHRLIVKKDPDIDKIALYDKYYLKASETTRASNLFALYLDDRNEIHQDIIEDIDKLGNMLDLNNYQESNYNQVEEIVNRITENSATYINNEWDLIRNRFNFFKKNRVD